MAYGTVNADVIQSSVANTSLGAGNASIMKNRIINGAMVIDQRNAGSAVTVDGAATYITDRFIVQDFSDAVLSAQQVVDAPAGFVNSLKVTVSTADTSLSATQGDRVNQRIEGYNIADLGWGTSDAKTITLSFWVKSTLTGTFGGSLENSATNRSYPFTYTISSASTWTLATVTIAGDTTGTWLTTNGIGVIVNWGLGVGSTYSGTAGSWQAADYISATGAVSVVGTLNATWQVTGVQLEVGSIATGFEYVNYQTSLANCQRYFQSMSIYVGGTSNNNYSWVTKRAAPTLASTAAGFGNNGVTPSQDTGWMTQTSSSQITVTISAEL